MNTRDAFESHPLWLEIGPPDPEPVEVHPDEGAEGSRVWTGDLVPDFYLGDDAVSAG